MNSKSNRITAAQETLQAFKHGFYETNNTRVDLAEIHEHTLSSASLHTPEMIDKIQIGNIISPQKTLYQLSSLPVVSCLKALKEEGKDNIGILNFASAKNPGGGFLNGALAQEESLAMCSNLYLSQLENQEYYEANRACKTMLYTDYMIYSRDTVFIREDAEGLWDTPLLAAVITAPAVNMGQYLLKGKYG